MARIAFCQNIMVEFMGCMSMSAALKLAGHEVEVFIDSGVRSGRFFSQVRDFRPDIAGFSVLTPSAPWALAAAERIKTENRCVAVFGNVHAIIQPEIIGHPGVDAVCRGEGEAPLVEMAGRLNRGLPFDDIPGLWVKTGGGVRKNPPAGDVLDLDSLPDHDRALYDKYSIFRRSRYLRFLLGRGCPHNCTYCTNAYMKAHYGPGYVRKRAPERAVAELERLVAERHPEIINFIDEVLWVNNEWLVKFLRLYKERIGLPFAANYRHGAIREEEVRLMAEAGCRHLVLAVESDEGKRLGLLGKRVTDAQILQAGALLRKYNIGMISHVLFGLPGDTVEGHLAQLPFFRKLDADYLWTSFFQPYPGLKILENPETVKHLPENIGFKETFHHEMVLDLPDRVALENLKKAYFLMIKAPVLEPALRKLIRYRLTFLFNLIFIVHFSIHGFRFERITVSQYVGHTMKFLLAPLARKLFRGRAVSPVK